MTLGVISIRKGHWVMFIIGLFLPLFWFIGALLPRECTDGIGSRSPPRSVHDLEPSYSIERKGVPPGARTWSGAFALSRHPGLRGCQVTLKAEILP